MSSASSGRLPTSSTALSRRASFTKIIPPFTVLRRLDYALEATKAKVLEKKG